MLNLPQKPLNFKRKNQKAWQRLRLERPRAFNQNECTILYIVLLITGNTAVLCVATLSMYAGNTVSPY